VEWWYAAVGAADDQADARRTGFDTTFHGSARFFGIAETGIVPLIRSSRGDLPGAYRIGLWYDPQPKERFDGAGFKQDDVGFYLSLDQMVYKEQSDPDDAQGLGLFARYGHADGDVNDIRCFWSVGAQYRGLVPSRDEDVLALGVGQGLLSKAAGYTADQETALELYYRAQITPWLGITPSVQWIANPGGQKDLDDAVVVGVRVQMAF
jgi:porin